MTIEEIKQHHSLVAEFERRGIKLIKSGADQFKCLCPFHSEKTPSCSIDEKKKLFFCHGCHAKGSIIDLICGLDGVSIRTAMERLEPSMAFREPPKFKESPGQKIVACYVYLDANGNYAYEVVRYLPKTFRQRHKNEAGEFIWGMDGVERVLYRLPEVLAAKEVWITEGEKDANNIAALGLCATCNVGGAGKWLDSYTESLGGKDVVLCGDTDEAGKAHIDLVQKSISGKVNTTRKIKLPDGNKDVSEFLSKFSNATEAKEALVKLFQDAQVLYRGVELPVYSMYEAQAAYIRHLQNLESSTFTFSRWLPSLACVRGLVPGELCCILAATSVGKTALLQNIAHRARPLYTLMFELELPLTLMFERQVCAASDLAHYEVEQAYKQGQTWDEGIKNMLDHIYVCDKSGLTVAKLEEYINRAELKTGWKPQLVLVDYIQLLKGVGSGRYEKTSNVAEDLKTLAKDTQTIVIASSQIGREKCKETGEPFLTSAKDSGSIENSSGLVIGAWRDSKDLSRMFLKVLKNTKGITGTVVPCRFFGQSMSIVEEAPEQQTNT